jgi:hypothetical protein
MELVHDVYVIMDHGCVFKVVLLLPISENSGDSNILQRRKRRGSSYKSNFDRKNVHYEHNGYMLLPSELQEDDGNVSLRNVHMEPKVRQ